MSVRMGRFGPFVQIGTKDDEDKPRFAGLRPGQKMDAITHEEALELFKLPRKLGLTAAGEEIIANVGRFGPYVKYGAKYVSLKTDDPYDDHARARARGDPREGDRGCQSADPGFSGRRHPGAERPLRSLHHRQDPQREDSQGPGAEEPDAGGVPGSAGGGARARLRHKWGRKNAKGGAPAKTNGASATADPPAAATKAARARKKTSAPAPATAPPPMRAAARLAAKGSKAAAKKRAPAETAAAAPPAAKTKRRKS